MQQLEGYFSQAMGGMNTYDPFMALHAGFYTTDLDKYLSAFSSGGVKYFPSSFVDTSTGRTFYSATVQTPGSLDASSGSFVVLQLIGNTSSILASNALPVHPVPQVSSQTLMKAEAATPATGSTPGRPPLTLLKVSWPTSNLTRDIAFFEGVLQGQQLFTASNDGLAVYSGKFLQDDKVEVQFVQHHANTQGPMSVADWEKYQTDLHSKCIVNPTQGFDRLADFHIGHAMASVDCAPYISAAKSSGTPYRFFGAGARPFLYIYGANGWGQQLICSCNDPAECPSGGGYDFCNVGITGHCSAKGPDSSLGSFFSLSAHSSYRDAFQCGNPNAGPVMQGIDLVDAYNSNGKATPKNGSSQIHATYDSYVFNFLSVANQKTFKVASVTSCRFCGSVDLE